MFSHTRSASRRAIAPPEFTLPPCCFDARTATRGGVAENHLKRYDVAAHRPWRQRRARRFEKGALASLGGSAASRRCRAHVAHTSLRHKENSRASAGGTPGAPESGLTRATAVILAASRLIQPSSAARLKAMLAGDVPPAPAAPMHIHARFHAASPRARSPPPRVRFRHSPATMFAAR